MGIDIYARWDGQSEAEETKQAKAWLNGEAGEVGYLREAYHGEPYATHHFVPEAFDSKDGAAITAATLRSRLPKTLRLAKRRQRTICNAGEEEIKRALQSYINFVELCERMEKATGKPVRIVASW